MAWKIFCSGRSRNGKSSTICSITWRQPASRSGCSPDCSNGLCAQTAALSIILYHLFIYFSVSPSTLSFPSSSFFLPRSGCIPVSSLPSSKISLVRILFFSHKPAPPGIGFYPTWRPRKWWTREGRKLRTRPKISTKSGRGRLRGNCYLITSKRERGFLNPGQADSEQERLSASRHRKTSVPGARNHTRLFIFKYSSNPQRG